MAAPAVATAKETRKRKRLPRGFNRRAKPWLQPMLELEEPTDERMLKVRRDVLGLSRADASRLLRVARNTIWDWETGYRRAPFSAYLALRLVADAAKRETSTGPWRRLPAAGNVVPIGQNRLGSLLKSGNGLADAARQTRLSNQRLHNQGKLQPLGLNPTTGKRLSNTGRYPTTGVYSPILAPSTVPTASLEGRSRPRRERANEMQERMHAFRPIYNAGWVVRDAYFGSDARRREKVFEFCVVLAQLLQQTEDYEALLFAVADTLYASPLGVPWEP